MLGANAMNNLRFEIQNQLLKKFFGFEKFQGLQEQTLRNLAKGQSTFLIQSTGSGKSLTYLYPTKIGADSPDSSGKTIVLTPLIALIDDQARSASQFGLRSLALHSQKTSAQKKDVLAKIQQGQFDVLFVTPERFRNAEFSQALTSISVQLLVVDEAHCISQWGHDFRPDYSKIGDIQKSLQNPMTLALTATASPRVEKEIQDSLGISSENTLRLPIYRDNLHIQVTELYGAVSKVDHFLDSSKQQAREVCEIVYFTLISSLRAFASELSRRKIPFLTYHGDLPADERRKNQQQFMASSNALLLATPAFGLGVDKKNIRRIVHFEIPGSLEAYSQEIGRAGRDGQKAYVELFFDDEDLLKQMEFIKWAHPEIEFLKSLDALVKNNALAFQQGGALFLKERLLFKNSRDYRVEASLNLLEKQGFYSRDPRTQKFERRDEPDWNLMLAALGPARMKAQNEHLLKLVQWAKQSEVCRWKLLSQAFGETLEEDCGHCDICL